MKRLSQILHKDSLQLVRLFAFIITLSIATDAHSQAPLQWARQFSGNLPSNTSIGWDVALDDADNSYVVGNFRGTINFGGTSITSTSSDFFFVKYNPSGTVQYVKKIGATNGNVVATGVSIFKDGSNNTFLYICGTFTSSNGSIITVNFNPNSPGGNLTMNDSSGDGFIAKYNASNGTFVWAKRVANTDSDYLSGGKVTVDQSGNAYVASKIKVGAQSFGALRKFDINGNNSWSFNIGSLVNNVAFRSNTIFVVGSGLGPNSKPIAWYNTSGTLLGSMGNNDYSYSSIVLDSSTGIYVGASKGNPGTSTFLAAIEKYTTSSTNPVWGKYFDAGFSGFSMDVGLTGTNQSELVVGGWFKGTVNFNNGIGMAYTITSSGSGTHDNIFVARYNAGSGSCLWVRNNTSSTASGQSDPLAIASNSSYFYVLGYVLYRTINSDFCGGTTNIIATNASNGYLAKYSAATIPVLSISGPFTICSSGTYTVANLPPNSTVTWFSGNPSGLSINTSGQASRVGGFNGPVEITAIINTPCGNLQATKSIQAGSLLSTQIPITGTAGVCPGNLYTYTVNPIGGLQSGYSYIWTKPSNWTIQSQYQNTITLYVPMYNPDYGAVRVWVDNGCGDPLPQNGITVYPGYGCDSFSFTAFPNPATTSLTVSLKQTDSAKNPESSLATNEFQAELKTDTGNRVIIQKSENGIVELNTEGLPRGLYILKAFFEYEVITERILIK